MQKIQLFLISLFSATITFASAQDLRLWYDKPAVTWEEAIPLGNARLGAMVYGIPSREEIQLNEETIWAGSPHNNDNPNALNTLLKVQKLIFERKNKEAERLINDSFFGGPHGMPYQTAGSLIVNFEGHKNFENYYRDLDLDRAVSTVRYTVNNIDYQREVFSSFSDDVIIMRLTSSKKESISFELSYQNPSLHVVSQKDNKLVLRGKGGDHEGIPGKIVYEIQTEVKNRGGIVEVHEDRITVTNATEAIIYLSIGTNFKDYKTLGQDPSEIATKLLNSAITKSYKKSVKDHSKIFTQQFHRFKLNLGEQEQSKTLTTTERIVSFAENQDPSMVTLLTQFGRYLLISSSQPGRQPANLQGIWNNSTHPAWDSKYTININTEMNYWPAEITNLTETHEPLFKMLEELSHTGKQTAKTMYNADGWVAHHNTDLWRIAGPVDFAAAGMWPTGGAWLCQHLWEHYLFTGDKVFLKKYFPVLKGASDFFISTLVKYPNSEWLVVSPSVSPEQGPITAGTTMDNQLVFDLLTKTAEANDLLGNDQQYSQKLREVADKIPPMHIGKHLQLQEWLEDIDDPKNEHRHVSHLYGLYPGSQISPYRTPELFQAAKQSLIYRGDQATGWSIGWKINLWARLLDGNHAYKIIQNMLTLAGKRGDFNGRTYPNLFTAHPPFQIDGNFGLTAGVTEMLLQSHDNAVHILPALPKNWKDGSVSGIMARGGFEVSMKWKNGEVTEVKVLSTIGGNLRLRSYTPLAGKKLTKAIGDNSNQLLQPGITVKHIVSDEIVLDSNPLLTEVFEYDLPTQAGKIYKFKADTSY